MDMLVSLLALAAIIIMSGRFTSRPTCSPLPVVAAIPTCAPQSGHRLSFFAQASVPSSTSAAVHSVLCNHPLVTVVEHLRDAGR